MTMDTLETLFIGLKAASGHRMCGGARSIGGLYLESGLTVDGAPIENFLIDAPHPVDPLSMGVTALGVTLYAGMDGVTHVLDMVGSSHYPFVSDFIEEGRTMGFSRKVSPTLDFSKLGPGSRLVFLHAKGRVDNWADFTPEMFPDFACPCGKGERHAVGTESCIGLHWQVAPGHTTVSRVRFLAPPNSYTLGRRDPAYPVPEAKYVPAMFASVPITSISLVSHGGKYDAAKLAKAQQSGLPVDVTEQ
jgi:hypothetical protein